MTHAGEIIKKAVESHGMKHSVLASRLSISRQTLYNIYENVDVDLTMIIKISAILNHPFDELLQRPEYRNDPRVSVVSEPSKEDLKAEIDYWKTRYISLLESITEILTAREKKQLKP